MQQQQQQQHQQPGEWTTPAENHPGEGGQKEEPGIWTSCSPPATIVLDGDGGGEAGSVGEADAFTDAESGSFSFDSDDTDSALDYLFVELMTEDDGHTPVPGRVEEGHGREDGEGGGEEGAADETRKGADGEPLLFLDAEDGVQGSPSLDLSLRAI